MAEAVNYTLGQWTELNVFCSDGAVPIDNNVSEREMKRVVLNRKNSLFVGNPRGGRTAAILASLTNLPPARDRSATLPHPTADEPSLAADATLRLAPRPVETPPISFNVRVIHSPAVQIPLTHPFAGFLWVRLGRKIFVRA